MSLPRSFSRLAAATALALTTGCAGPLGQGIEWPDPETVPDLPSLPEAGTVERYRAQLHGVDAAAAEVRFLESNDPTTIITQLHFRTVGLFALINPTQETITVSCDADTWRPRSVLIESVEKKEVRRHELHFDDRLGAVAMERDGGDFTQQLTVYGVEPWEPLSLALRMRDRETLLGFEGSFELLLGARLHRVKLRGVEQEPIDGTIKSAWRLEGEVHDVSVEGRDVAPRAFQVWVGISPNRPLLRMQLPTDLGVLTLERVSR